MPQYSMAMEKKYGKSVATQLANPANYITRSQADAMGLGTEKRVTAPDGGSVAGYQERLRNSFLPTPTPEQEAYWQLTHQNESAKSITERMKMFSKVGEAQTALQNTAGGYYGFDGRTWARMSAIQRQPYELRQQKWQKIISDHFYEVAVKPFEENQKKLLAIMEQEKKDASEQRIATLVFRVSELEKEKSAKRPTPEPTTPAVTSSLPIIPIIIIAVIVGFFLLRRRA